MNSCDDSDDSDLARQTRAPHPRLGDQLGVEADGEAVYGGLQGGDHLLADVGGGGRGGGRDMDTQPAVAELLHHKPDLEHEVSQSSEPAHHVKCYRVLAGQMKCQTAIRKFWRFLTLF